MVPFSLDWKVCKTVKVPWENLLSKYTSVNKADLEVLHCWSGGVVVGGGTAHWIGFTIICYGEREREKQDF